MPDWKPGHIIHVTFSFTVVSRGTDQCKSQQRCYKICWSPSFFVGNLELEIVLPSENFALTQGNRAYEVVRPGTHTLYTCQHLTRVSCKDFRWLWLLPNRRHIPAWVPAPCPLWTVRQGAPWHGNISTLYQVDSRRKGKNNDKLNKFLNKRVGNAIRHDGHVTSLWCTKSLAAFHLMPGINRLLSIRGHSLKLVQGIPRTSLLIETNNPSWNWRHR